MAVIGMLLLKSPWQPQGDFTTNRSYSVPNSNTSFTTRQDGNMLCSACVFSFCKKKKTLTTHFLSTFLLIKAHYLKKNTTLVSLPLGKKPVWEMSVISITKGKWIPLWGVALEKAVTTFWGSILEYVIINDIYNQYVERLAVSVTQFSYHLLAAVPGVFPADGNQLPTWCSPNPPP